MQATLIQHSIVVLGETHNPTILNPDFLVGQNIVPKAWGWEHEETFTTPPLAIIRYKNGVTIMVESNKLQVTDGNVGPDPAASKVGAIGAAYVLTLPHVHYTAVGTNFQSVVEHPEPETWLQERFLRPGPWNAGFRPLHSAGFRFVYLLADQTRVTLSLDAAKATDKESAETRNVIVLHANFHRSCGDHPTHKEVASVLVEKVAGDWDSHQRLLANTVLNGDTAP